MKYRMTQSLKKIRAMKNRIRIVQGGSSAGKTIAILMDELNEAIKQPGIVTSIISDTLPNLRTGAIRDFLAICRETNVINFATWNKAIHTLELPNGSTIEFYSVDTMGALGARRDRLFVNEANRISYETFSQLEIRTRQKITIDFNPVNEFWAHKELMARPDADFIKLTYKDNGALDKATVDALELRRGDGTSNWWRVYGLGEIGSLEGNVYEGWERVDEVPEEYIIRCVGVDFGFANDPTAVVGIFENEDGAICLKEYLYEMKLLTPQLIERLKGEEEIKDELFVCDNARPEIIAEMNANGLRAIGCNKTAGEKMNGKRYNIELVQRRKIRYIGKNIESEFLTYAWRKKVDGTVLDEPKDGNDHAMDAIAYGIRELSYEPVTYGGVL